jgi:hypothetical protein
LLLVRFALVASAEFAAANAQSVEVTVGLVGAGRRVFHFFPLGAAGRRLGQAHATTVLRLEHVALRALLLVRLVLVADTVFASADA